MSRRSLLALALVLLVVVLGAAAWVIAARRAPGRPLVEALRPAPVRRIPVGTRVKVQVLNTTRLRGRARRAAHLLRDQGFDVVEMGTTGPLRDTTLVIDRSGHPGWAAAVAAALAPARVAARADSSRYLDISVLLGARWHPPALPLDP